MPRKPTSIYCTRGALIAWLTSEGLTRYVINKALSQKAIASATFSGRKKRYVVASAEAYFFPSAASNSSQPNP